MATKRIVVVALAAVLALVTGLPSVTAELADGDVSPACKRLAGRYACAAVDYGECTVWLSAGVGGCWIVPLL